MHSSQLAATAQGWKQTHDGSMQVLTAAEACPRISYFEHSHIVISGRAMNKTSGCGEHEVQDFLPQYADTYH